VGQGSLKTGTKVRELVETTPALADSAGAGDSGS
jgi:hypothetical protein